MTLFYGFTNLLPSDLKEDNQILKPASAFNLLYFVWLNSIKKVKPHIHTWKRERRLTAFPNDYINSSLILHQTR